MSTIDIIVDLLKKEKKKQKDLTDYLGITKNAFTDWKSGRIKSYQKHLPEIAEFFGCSVEYLVGKEDVSDKLQLKGIDLLLYNEMLDLTNEEKESILDYVKYTKGKRP